MFQVQRKQKYMHHRARERQEEKRTPRPHNIPFITRHMDDPARLNAFRTVFWTVLWSWTSFQSLYNDYVAAFLEQ